MTGVLDPLQRTRLYEAQRGRCPACGQHLTTQAAAHHRRLRSQGGTWDDTNIVLIHPDCHTWVHANPQAAVQAGLIVPSWADPATTPITGRST